MKLAVISDCHVGDNASCLVKYPVDGPKGLPTLQKLASKIGKVDCLVFLGDILDFSVRNREDVMKGASIFFEAFKDCTNTFIYIPGNHDVEAWELAREENFAAGIYEKHSNPIIITDLSNHMVCKGGIEDTFMDELVDGMKFHVAYPNCYLHVDKKFTLLTHGHYWEPYWSLGAELGQCLMPATLQSMNIDERVAMNHPLSQLACSGLGSAGPLVPMIRGFQQGVKGHDRYRIKVFTEVIRKFIVEKSNANLLTRGALHIGEWYLLRKLMGYKEARNNAQWLKDPQTQKRIIEYLNSCIHEINMTPQCIIFGHTHIPMRTMYSAIIYVNTGGWLDGGKGSIVTYESNQGWQGEKL